MLRTHRSHDHDSVFHLLHLDHAEDIARKIYNEFKVVTAMNEQYQKEGFSCNNLVKAEIKNNNK